MGFTPEPILDIARGLSAFTAAYILGNQVLVVMREVFIDRCSHCKGAGRVICQHCGGTKTMRNRQGEFHVSQMDIVERRPRDVSQCIHCGPLTIYDLVQEAQDDEDEAFDIMDNMKDAYAGRVRTHRMPILAGTVPCPQCLNHPTVRRHTPNFARILRLEDPWWWPISARVGRFSGALSPIRKQQFIEYPSREPHVDDLDPKGIIDAFKGDYELTVEQSEEKDEKPYWEEELEYEEMAALPKTEEEEAAVKPEGNAWTARGQMTEYDFVTKYVDDSESEEDEDMD